MIWHLLAAFSEFLHTSLFQNWNQKTATSFSIQLLSFRKYKTLLYSYIILVVIAVELLLFVILRFEWKLKMNFIWEQQRNTGFPWFQGGFDSEKFHNWTNWHQLEAVRRWRHWWIDMVLDPKFIFNSKLYIYMKKAYFGGKLTFWLLVIERWRRRMTIS